MKIHDLVRRRLSCVVLLAVVAWSFHAAAPAQEATEEEESLDENNPYLSLRRSDDRAAQLTAERYFNLVKRQEWTDITGKYKTMGKYVAHDPNLQWVRLEVSRGTGRDRVTKEIEVPVAKLSKVCQSRVRQIARLQPKLDELVAAEAAKPDEDELAGGAPMIDERGNEASLENYGAELGADLRGAAQPADFGRGTPAEASGDWRTDYESFRQNISLSMGPDGQPKVEWGALTELRTLSEALAVPASQASDERNPGGRQRMIAEASAQLGEVRWEAPFAGISRGLLGTKVNFQVAPPSPPATIQFLVADQANLQQLAQLQPGQPVRFQGKLGLLTPNSIVVWITLTEEQAGALAPSGREDPRGEQFNPGEFPGGLPPRR